MDTFSIYRYHWRKAQEIEKQGPEAFLKDRERFCVSACARFRNLDYFYDHAWIFAAEGMTETSAMILHSKRTIFPVFDGNAEFNISASLSRALKNIDVHALHGLAGDTDILEAILYPLGIKAVERMDFYLMDLDSFGNMGKLRNPPRGLILRRASDSDMEGLFALQSAYEQEEVLPSGAVFDARLCRLNLSKIIKYEKTLVAVLDGKIVGKINTNAQAYTYYQLGGVYVAPKYRSLGIGSCMISAFVRLLLSEGKGVTLFVRKENKAALSSYQHAGFKIIDNYRIVYM
jgi:predicted GNAT family acetyltransferase